MGLRHGETRDSRLGVPAGTFYDLEARLELALADLATERNRASQMKALLDTWRSASCEELRHLASRMPKGDEIRGNLEALARRFELERQLR